MIIISRRDASRKLVQEDLNPRLIYYFHTFIVQAVILSRTKKVIVTITSGFLEIMELPLIPTWLEEDTLTD